MRGRFKGRRSMMDTTTAEMNEGGQVGEKRKKERKNDVYEWLTLNAPA
jgi:hypothetical protein